MCKISVYFVAGIFISDLKMGFNNKLNSIYILQHVSQIK
ncbi:hypothetical protein MuYL_3610 [Mucilaginibacter xinganensis]|uniref:Uncharacterized protein n=1 Tax=Mucilaginibacter xinganensis TaxID=1234841 RepID=A0A223P059_9SPHI|nr:hypothetical protein MuYL_3610 [Mucilaginibacter xinganensis]